MTLKPLDRPGTGQTTAERGLHPLGAHPATGMRPARSGPPAPGYSLAVGMIGESARKVWRQAKRVFRPHYLTP